MNLNLTSATRIGLNVLALLGASAAMYLGQSVFIPLVFSALLAVILFPAAKWLEQKLKFPWFLACLTVIFGLVIVNIAVFIGFGMAVPQILADVPNPRDAEQVRGAYAKAREVVSSFSTGSVDRILPRDPDESTVFTYIRNFLTGTYVTDQLLKLASLSGALFLQSIIVLFILLFLLLEGEFLANRIKDVFGDSRVIQGQVAKALGEMAEAIRSYLIWRTLVNIGLGLFLGIVYAALGLKQPWTWALFTAILCYVPYIGTILAGIPPVVDALIHCNAYIAVFIIVLYTIVVTVEGYLIVPLVMGRSMDLNATTVMIACLYWDLVWGTSGLFLAMPLMAGIRAICMNVQGWRPFGHLMMTEKGYQYSQKDKLTPVPTEPAQDLTPPLEQTVVMNELPDVPGPEVKQ